MKKDHIKPKPRAKFPKPLPRRMIVDALLDAYAKDCEEVLINFPGEYKVELTEHMIAALDILEEYAQTQEKATWKKYTDLEQSFLKKHKNRLQLYRQKRLGDYFHTETAIWESDIFTAEEFNKLSGEEQVLTEKEMEKFFFRARNFLCLERDQQLLNEEPGEKNSEKENQELSGKDPKVTLSMQLLIIYYLLKGLGVEVRSNVNISEVARFSHSLLGKKIGKLSNSDIYKRLRKIPNIKSDKELQKELISIRHLFRALDLRDIVHEIDKEIGIARKERLKKGEDSEA